MKKRRKNEITKNLKKKIAKQWIKIRHDKKNQKNNIPKV